MTDKAWLAHFGGCSSCDETFDVQWPQHKTLGTIPGSLPGTCGRVLAHCEWIGSC